MLTIQFVGTKTVYCHPWFRQSLWHSRHGRKAFVPYPCMVYACISQYNSALQGTQRAIHRHLLRGRHTARKTVRHAYAYTKGKNAGINPRIVDIIRHKEHPRAQWICQQGLPMLRCEQGVQAAQRDIEDAGRHQGGCTVIPRVLLPVSDHVMRWKQGRQTSRWVVSATFKSTLLHFYTFTFLVKSRC